MNSKVAFVVLVFCLAQCMGQWSSWLNYEEVNKARANIGTACEDVKTNCFPNCDDNVCGREINECFSHQGLLNRDVAFCRRRPDTQACMDNAVETCRTNFEEYIKKHDNCRTK